MSDRFSTARHCHAVLSILLNDLHTQFDDDGETRRPITTDENIQKRRKLDTASSTLSSQPRSPSNAQLQSGDMSQPITSTATEHSPMIAPSDQPQFTQPNFSYQQSNQFMPWPEPMMPADVGDVFGQVSWEALFQGDGSEWGDWEAIGAV
jgi:hypothetical protein